MNDSRESGPSEHVLAFAARHLRTPAELDLLVHAQRSGGPCTSEELAAVTGLRLTHAQLCMDALVEAGMLTVSSGRYAVADDVASEAAAIASVFDRYRRRLVISIMDGWSEG